MQSSHRNCNQIKSIDFIAGDIHGCTCTVHNDRIDRKYNYCLLAQRWREKLAGRKYGIPLQLFVYRSPCSPSNTIELFHLFSFRSFSAFFCSFYFLFYSFESMVFYTQLIYLKFKFFFLCHVCKEGRMKLGTIEVLLTYVVINEKA